MARGSDAFSKLVPQLEKIFGNKTKNIPPSPNVQKIISAAVKRTNSSFIVNDPLDMLIELEGKGYHVEESDLHHRLTLAVASGAAEEEEFFNTTESAAGEHICNIQEAKQMAKESVFFIREIFLTGFDDLALDEMKRIAKGAILKIQFRSGTDYLKRKAIAIPGMDLMKPMRLGVATGASNAIDGTANPDTYRISTVHPQGKGWVLPRYFKLPENIPFKIFLDFVDTTAVQIAGDMELFMAGIYGSKKG